MPLLKMKVGDFGKDFKFEGQVGQNGLIKTFVEAHYLLYGEITPVVHDAIQAHSENLKNEVIPTARKRLGMGT